MDCAQKTFSDLFDQLGLPSDENSIRQFCDKHHMEDTGALPDADFWTPQQAQFLRECWHNDSDWVMLIDQLNTSLRKPMA